MSSPVTQRRSPHAVGATPKETQERVAKSLRRRYWAERRFRFYGLARRAARHRVRGVPVRHDLLQGRVELPAVVHQGRCVLRPGDHRAERRHAKRAGHRQCGLSGHRARRPEARFPQVESRKDVRDLTRLVSGGAAFDLRDRVLNTAGSSARHETQWLLASDDVDMLMKGHIGRGTEAEPGPLNAEPARVVRPAR